MSYVDRSHRADEYERQRTENEREMCRLEDEAAERRRFDRAAQRRRQLELDTGHFEAHFHSLIQQRAIDRNRTNPGRDQERHGGSNHFRAYMFD